MAPRLLGPFYIEAKFSDLSRDLKRAAAKGEADVYDILTRAVASGAAREVK